MSPMKNLWRKFENWIEDASPPLLVGAIAVTAVVVVLAGIIIKFLVQP